MPIIVSGGPAHSTPYATTPAVPVKNHLTAIAGWPRMIQIWPRGASCICLLYTSDAADDTPC
eukprot:8577514-Pyramimonas_sp.AAC.1